MELIIGREPEKDCVYVQEDQRCNEFLIREPGGLDYACATVLLRNLGERKDTTSLEREALSIAVRLIQRNIEAKKS